MKSAIKNRKRLGVGMAVVGLLPIGLFWFNLRPEGQPLPLPTNEWKTVFSDNFEGDTLDGTKWVTCYDWYNKQYNGCTNEGNNESQWYTPSQVEVGGGYVTLTAKRQPTVGWFKTWEQVYPFRSGMVATGRPSQDTEPKWAGSYGYYEARMKVSGGQAVWPAFWLLPADRSWPPEIDIMELLGDKQDQVLMTHHWPGPANRPAKDNTTYTGRDFTQDWHTYAINWQEGQIDWYIDGVLRKTAKGKHVPSKPMEIILNLAIGGNLPGWPDETTPDTSTVQVDYVKVRQPPVFNF